MFVEMNEEEQMIYDFLLKNGKELLDLIAIQCEMPVFKISSVLIQMELKGLIRPLPGKYFEAI
jgi:DNA processing protein